MALAGLLAGIGLAPWAQAQSAPSKPAAKPAAKKPAKPPVKKPAAKKPVAPPPEVVPAAASPTQLEAAQKVYYGVYECEFKQTVDIHESPKYPGYVDVKYGKHAFVMQPVVSTTGAIRLEDVKGETLMVQISSKSMMLNVSTGQRMVDDCISPKQREAIEAAARAKAEAEAAATAGGGAASAPAEGVSLPLLQAPPAAPQLPAH